MREKVRTKFFRGCQLKPFDIQLTETEEYKEFRVMVKSLENAYPHLSEKAGIAEAKQYLNRLRQGKELYEYDHDELLKEILALLEEDGRRI